MDFEYRSAKMHGYRATNAGVANSLPLADEKVGEAYNLSQTPYESNKKC
jgi:hypothetical protein